MKTIFTAAAIAFAIGAGSAHASSGFNGLGLGGTGRYGDAEDGYLRGDRTNGYFRMDAHLKGRVKNTNRHPR
jgi:hypothetical protein